MILVLCLGMKIAAKKKKKKHILQINALFASIEHKRTRLMMTGFNFKWEKAMIGLLGNQTAHLVLASTQQMEN